MVDSQLILVIFTNLLNKNHVILIIVIHYGFIKGQGGTLMWFGWWWINHELKGTNP